jgi:hypothetical protein
MEVRLLLVVCLGYGFSSFLLADNTVFLFIFVFYLIDQMPLSINMARSMYMNKNAVKEEDIRLA